MLSYHACFSLSYFLIYVPSNLLLNLYFLPCSTSFPISPFSLSYLICPCHTPLPTIPLHHREQKIVKNASQHIQLTAQRLVDEDALTTACFHSLEDDIIEKERRAARMHLYRYNNGVKKVLQMKEELQEECSSRLAEDSILLDTLIESQQLLQHTVHKHFFVLPNIAPYTFIYSTLPIVLYCTLLSCTVLSYIVLPCTVQYCTVLYCTDSTVQYRVVQDVAVQYRVLDFDFKMMIFTF